MATILDTIQSIERALVDATPISTNQLRQKLLAKPGAKIASIVTRTIPPMRKTNNPFYGNCYKLKKSSVVINPSDSGYEDSVNKQRLRELLPPNFEAEPRLWGTKLKKQPFIAHVNKTGENNSYLWVKVEKVAWERFVDSDGIFLDAEEIAPYIQESSRSKRQGTEKEIRVRNFAIENVIGIYLEGEKFLVQHT